MGYKSARSQAMELGDDRDEFGRGGCRMKFGFGFGEVQTSRRCFLIATTLLSHVLIVEPLDFMRKAIHKCGGSYTSQ
jgi:hypothetical protein